MQQSQERDLARRWASGELIGLPLRTTSGERLTVLYPGRPGGGAGPDFRDAVIRLGDVRTVYGDVEIHLRGRSWRSHGHADDPHYQQVVLHVVYSTDLQPTRLPDGQNVPVLALADVVPPATLPLHPSEGESWPCQQSQTRLVESALLALLDSAGESRFLEKAAAFLVELATVEAEGSWSAESMVLFRALAEGMGYGRERDLFRTLGEHLAAIAPGIASPAAANDALHKRLGPLPKLDQQRIAALCALAFRWRERGPWPEVHSLLSLADTNRAKEKLLSLLTFSDESASAYIAREPPRFTIGEGTRGYSIGEPSEDAASQDTASAARSSAGRAAILVWNVALPFAYAWAWQQDDAELAERIRLLAVDFPGLPSNQITRAMQKQLLLTKHPRMALAQQGLQHIHKRWCREKICAACPCAKGVSSAS
ncbi:MAG TPA: DUF2851 family protein [Ktedonobacterales bacterium]